MKIPVITLWQPWASWIAEGWKTIETRTHPKFASLAGGPLLIHAGQRLDGSFLAAEAESYLTDEQRRITRELRMIRGKIVCEVWVDGHVRCVPGDARRALVECDSERYGLLLSGIRKLNPPIPARGAQGIWYIDDEIIKEVQ